MIKYCVTLYPSEVSFDFSTPFDVMHFIGTYLGNNSVQLINVEQYEEETVYKVRDTRGHAGE